MKQSELITNNLDLNPDSGIHHMWFPVFIFFSLKFLPSGKAMKASLKVFMVNIINEFLSGVK